MGIKTSLVLSFLAILVKHGSSSPIWGGDTGLNDSMEYLSRRESSSVTITKMAAIGDSYSAGIGAGMLLGPWTDWSKGSSESPVETSHAVYATDPIAYRRLRLSSLRPCVPVFYAS